MFATHSGRDVRCAAHVRPVRGFASCELLVVITLFAIMISLLLPAVQAVRQAARQALCFNRLKQLGAAIQQHEQALRFYPSAGQAFDAHVTFIAGSPARAPYQRAGWGYQILPYLEAEDAGPSESPPAGATELEQSIHAIKTPRSAFFCGARGAVRVVSARDWYRTPVNSGQTFGHAMTDFAGACRDGSGLGGVLRRTEMDGPDPRFHVVTTRERLLDGLAETLLLAEKRLNLHDLGRLQPDDNEGYTAGCDQDSMRRFTLAPARDPDEPGATGDHRFGSSHRNGFQALTADGRVATLRYDLDLPVFARLGQSDDGADEGPAPAAE